MNIQQALNVFGLFGELTEQDIKTAYKKASLKFHPDRNQGNPVAAEMMKAVNCAYDFLMQNMDKINAFQSEEATAHYNYGEELENALNALHALSGVIFEVTGNWIWISGDTKPHKEALKAMGCKWANQKKMWFFRPEEYKAHGNRKSHSMDEIRAMYGTTGAYKAKGSRQIESRA
ncbi:chaperone protein DnaJ [Xenorhabdus mauleonii]|uniref:Chaperone protein DnaJ n=1 Tax=Xenorhabdus mauleonii TaxID=351675 RepID=A0A1I3XBL1_9GAMM|nr:J domain-containing protein [Xenorhabdus mauleonii]MDM5172020.1 DnaJ domain-containing protein [Escherichia coli]PHM36552.1 chaperone protein DnaJ [Xenorhabdus mauleonii]SFK16943.1 DnaJ domain-containing protein [Xenorhabdus mauleonii]